MPPLGKACFLPMLSSCSSSRIDINLCWTSALELALASTGWAVGGTGHCQTEQFVLAYSSDQKPSAKRAVMHWIFLSIWNAFRRNWFLSILFCFVLVFFCFILVYFSLFYVLLVWFIFILFNFCFVCFGGFLFCFGLFYFIFYLFYFIFYQCSKLAGQSSYSFWKRADRQCFQSSSCGMLRGRTEAITQTLPRR